MAYTCHSSIKCRDNWEMQRLGASNNREEKEIDDRDISNESKRQKTMDTNENKAIDSQVIEGSSSTLVASSSTQIPIMNDNLVPCFGSIAVSGRSRSMEDAVCMRPYLCRPVLTEGKAVHFFAVYDGHGGPHVAMLCKERMHVYLKAGLERDGGMEGETDDDDDDEVSDGDGGVGGGLDLPQEGVGDPGVEEKWRKIFERSFERMDMVALTACACGRIGIPPCGCLQSGLPSDIVGSTAVVAVITFDQIIVANCGDSRAVLSRGGRAFPLSFDHKPDRPDELARIEARGGRVMYVNGARVHGILAMSRALGDRFLKPAVSSEPEVTFTNRTPEDECLILASDGLWDVISNELACDVAHRCLTERTTPRIVNPLNNVPLEANSLVQTHHQSQSQYRCSVAAALLTRLALGRRSGDNISVIVIDLKNLMR